MRVTTTQRLVRNYVVHTRNWLSADPNNHLVQKIVMISMDSGKMKLDVNL